MASPAMERSTSVLSALLAGAALGVLAYLSPQSAGALALCVTVIALYVRSRPIGLGALWAMWLLIPMARRLFALIEAAPGADPLSLAPFAATGCIAAIELYRTQLDRRIKLILGLAAAGLLLGVPSGASSLRAMLFAFGAYVAGLTAITVGYAENARSLRELSLYRALVAAAIPLAAYGIAQYFLPLPSWDDLWRASVAEEYESLGSPEEGHVRVWSALNGPGTLAAVLALTVLLLLASRRLTRLHAVALAVATTCLSLTFVRSAWVGLVAGIVVLGITGMPGAGKRATTMIAILALGVVGLAGAGSTGAAFSERVLTIGSPEEDISAQERSRRTREFGEVAVVRPFGEGLGSAGEAAQLRGPGGLSDPDNGYLSILYQVGPVGFLLVLAAVIYGMTFVIQALRRERGSALAAALVTGLAFFLTMQLFGDAFYGVTGAMFWYLVGAGIRLRVEGQRADPGEPTGIAGYETGEPPSLPPAAGARSVTKRTPLP